MCITKLGQFTLYGEDPALTTLECLHSPCHICTVRSVNRNYGRDMDDILVCFCSRLGTISDFLPTWRSRLMPLFRPPAGAVQPLLLGPSSRRSFCVITYEGWSIQSTVSSKRQEQTLSAQSWRGLGGRLVVTFRECFHTGTGSDMSKPRKRKRGTAGCTMYAHGPKILVRSRSQALPKGR